MGAVLSSLLSQVVVGLVFACQLVGFCQFSSLVSISGGGGGGGGGCGGGESSRRRCGGNNNEIGMDDDSAALAAWCACYCCCPAASLRSASGAAHADSQQARRQQRERCTATNNSVQCASSAHGGRCHPHRQRRHNPRCYCGGCCLAPAAIASRQCSCSTASSSQQQATRVCEGDCTSANASEHDHDNAIIPRQKEKNQLAWLSPLSNHNNNNINNDWIFCNLPHKLQQHRHHSKLCTSTSIDNNNRKFKSRNSLRVLQQQQARVRNAKLTTSGKTRRHCNRLDFRQNFSETSAGESAGASDEEAANADSTSSESSNTSISYRKNSRARAPTNNNAKLNQRPVVLSLDDHKFQHDDSAAKAILQGKTTISNLSEYSNNNKNSLTLLELNLLELKTTKTITKTTTTITSKLKFPKRDTRNEQEPVRASHLIQSVQAGDYVGCDMAVLMSSQVPAVSTTIVSPSQLPRQVAQTASKRQLKRQANLRSENQQFGEPAICTDDNNLKQKKQAKQKQKQLVSQQKGNNKNTGDKPITSRTFYSQSSSDSSRSSSSSSSSSGVGPSTTKNRNTVKLSKQQRKLSAGGAPLIANVNSNRQVTGQLGHPRQPPTLAGNFANQDKLQQIATLNRNHHQYHQQQQHQYNKFNFDRNQICNREHRSLSTCSSITTESNESSSGVAPPSSASSANYSPASSGYSSPCSGGGGGATTTASHHLSDKLKKFKPQPIKIKTYNSYTANSRAQVSMVNTPSSTSSSVDSGTGASLIDLATVGVRQQQPLHPTVSALLMSTANLSLNKQVAITPPPATPPIKKSKKLQQQAYKNYLHLSRSPSTSAPSSSAADIKPPQYTQDSTYLARFEELEPPPVLAAPVAPPRPWLKPEEQLNYLSKSRLRQLKRSMDQRDHHLNDPNPKRRSNSNFNVRDQRLFTGSLKIETTNNIKLNQQQQQQQKQVSSIDEFTVLSYNVLSDRMVNTERFPSSPITALNWLYRRELILRQLLDYDADVIALQELEWEQYETYFKPKLEAETFPLAQSEQAYCSVFEPKSRARTMDWQMRKRVDGCAIFYKRHKFKLVARHLLEFNQIAMANARGSEAMLNRVMTKDNIGLAAVLELRNGSDSLPDHPSEESHPNQQPRRLIVCNTHIHWDPDCCDVKLVQTIMLMNELKHIARHYSEDLNNNYPVPTSSNSINQNNLLLPLLLLGDFNSLPKSGVLEFLLGANIDSSHKDFKDIRYTQCSNAIGLRDCAHPQASSDTSDSSSGLLVPSLVRRSSQQPTGGAAKGEADLHPKRPATFEPNLLLRRQSSPITNSTTTTTTTTTLQVAQESIRSKEQDKILQQVEISLHYEHPFKLASAYECGVMPFTNYTTKFKAIIDYIFFDQLHVELTGLLGPLDKQWLKANRIHGFPQLQFPSDHLPLLARFRLRDFMSGPPPPATASLCSDTPAVLLKDCHVKASML